MPRRMSIRGRKVLVTGPCRFQRKREREKSLNWQDQAVLSAKKFNVSAKKGHIFSVNAKKVSISTVKREKVPECVDGDTAMHNSYPRSGSPWGVMASHLATEAGRWHALRG